MANEYLVTTNTVEVLGAPTSANAVVTTNAIEVLANPATSNAVITTNVIEVLASVASGAPRRRQMVLS